MSLVVAMSYDVPIMENEKGIREKQEFYRDILPVRRRNVSIKFASTTGSFSPSIGFAPVVSGMGKVRGGGG